MTKILAFRPLLATSLPLALPRTLPLAACAAVVVLSAASVNAAPAVKTQGNAKALPPKTAQYLTMAQIKALQRQRAQAHNVPGAALQPMIDELPINVPMRDLLSGPTPDFGAKVPDGKGGFKKNRSQSLRPLRAELSAPGRSGFARRLSTSHADLAQMGALPARISVGRHRTGHARRR